MKSIQRANKLTVILGVLLITSNAYWIYAGIDDAVTRSYMTQQLHEYDAALKQVQTMLPIAFEATDKDSFVANVQEVLDDESFEKDGCIWIGMLGLQFDGSSSLAHVSRTWSFGEADPCYPDITP